ncbi:MAG: AI-2E family transporter [Thiohalophilus sp.]
MNTQQQWLLLVVLGTIGLVLYLLGPILAPFVTAAILAYMADPLADRLQTWKMPRTLAVVVVFMLLAAFALLLLLVLVPLIEDQLRVLVQKLPRYIDWLQAEGLPWLTSRLGMEETTLDLATLKNAIQQHWQQAGGVVREMIGQVSRSGLALVGWIANLLVTIVVAFYLLRDWDDLVERLHALLPRRNEAVVARLARQSDEVLGSFLRGQLLVMLALGLIYSVGLSIIGLDFALLIGLVAGLISFVPYLGTIVGVVVALIAALLQFHDPLYLGYVGIVFIIGQMLEGMVLTPLLVGDRIGLHPVAVIFAVLAGGQLFGFVGVLLALPVAAVAMVLLRHAHEQYRQSRLYNENSDTGTA